MGQEKTATAVKNALNNMVDDVAIDGIVEDEQGRIMVAPTGNYVETFAESLNTGCLVCYDFGEGESGEIAQYKALNNPDTKLSKMVDSTISLVGYVLQSIVLPDPVTGKPMDQPRIILIDESGKTYDCVSIGVYMELKKLAQSFSFPRTPGHGLNVKVVEKSGKKGYKYMTLELQ